MESAKQLKKVIGDYRQNAFYGGFPDDDKLGEFIKNETLSNPDSPPLAKFLCSMGSKGGAGIAAMARVWEFQDEIKSYQKHNNISSVLWREVDWMGEKIRFPISTNDLEFMPQDGPILTRWKYRTIDKFIDFICHHNLETLLCESIWEDEEEKDIPIALPQVYGYAKQYQIAWLSGGIEKPVYIARETDNPGVYSTSRDDIAYHLTEYGLWLDLLPTPLNPDPDSIHVSVKIRRYE